MLFSVIVPVYNAEKYIKQCVDSILNQSYSDFEVILVDDGSPDNCPAICDEYAKKDSRVKVIHKENGGHTSARNCGLEIAKGEYVTFVDSDDYVKQNFLATFADIIDKKDVDIVLSQHFTFDDGKEVLVDNMVCEQGYYDRKRIEKEVFPVLFEDINGKHLFPFLCAKVYRKSLILPIQLKVDKKIVIGEDGICLKPCIYHANSLYFLEDHLYGYRENFNSLTKSKKAQNLKEPLYRVQALEKRMNLDEYDFKMQLYRTTLHSLFYVVCSQFYRKEKYKIIVKDIKENLKEPFYKECIKKCVSKSKKLKLVKLALNNKMFWLIKLYNHFYR